ncbi:hypothetical protein CYMTET_30109 [Cymbomonas tetramitiformis]|uniref:PKD/REJ-like domain-containing protein n=1 Tax=Cymbomonas tetramitiformis TaxID=36881 RepID=A0AAE0FJH1_9CHLO|nr:hypothetical protein CYMTET_30109 [Cymbomonas tetramitiformis]
MVFGQALVGVPRAARAMCGVCGYNEGSAQHSFHNEPHWPSSSRRAYHWLNKGPKSAGLISPHSASRPSAGAQGDGEVCEMCTLQLQIQSSTVVDGMVKRAFQNQIIGSLTGLDDAACEASTETTFQWGGTSSDGMVLALTEEQNRASTLRLNFPKSTLTTYLSYSVTLSARVTASPEVRAEDALTFYVEPQALVALVTPSELESGEDSTVMLDASASYDPDGEEGGMNFEWRCAREGTNCRDRSGALLPPTWTSATLSLTLEGSVEGLVYSFNLKLSKAGREAEALVRVTMNSGPLPVPSIVALPGKVNANNKVSLTSSVESIAPATVTRAWSVAAEAGTAAIDLSTAASTPLNQADLVIRAGSLQARFGLSSAQVDSAYLFKLQAQDSVGPAFSTLRVVVNSPPAPGTFTVTPVSGTVLDTEFQMAAGGWEDEDTPLWYQLSYMVTGGETNPQQTMLNEYKPETRASTKLPEEGLEAFGREVQMFVTVRDALGAVTSASATVEVQPVVVADEAELTSYVDAQLASSLTLDSNGDVDASLLVVDGIASLLNNAGASRRRRRRERRRALLHEDAEEDAEQIAARSAQREVMMDLISSGKASLVSTDSTLERMSSSTEKVVGNAEEVAPELQSKGFSMMDSLVADAASPDTTATMTMGAVGSVGGALSNLVLAGVVNPAGGESAPNPAAQGLGILGAMAVTLASGMVDGEEGATVDTAVLSMLVQQDDLADPTSGAFAAPLLSPSGAAVSFPSSLGPALGGGSAAIKLLTSTVDPHVNISANTSAALRRLLEEEGALATGALESVSTAVTSIALSGADGKEMVVHGLSEAITFSLPLQAPDSDSAINETAPPQCAFFDTSTGSYSRAGCTARPNPRPPQVELNWWTLNASKVEGELRRMWSIDPSSSGFLSGCEESFEAVFPEYLGTDAGYRKFLGEGCVAADPENNASCWWQWDAQAFLGPGCVYDQEIHCLCTHLTDFKAVQDQEVGTLGPPKVTTVGADDMTSLTPGDVLQSITLLAVLGGLMTGCVLLAWLSNWAHHEGVSRKAVGSGLRGRHAGSPFLLDELLGKMVSRVKGGGRERECATDKLSIFRQLMTHHGTDNLWFKTIGETWTWSLMARFHPS